MSSTNSSRRPRSENERLLEAEPDRATDHSRSERNHGEKTKSEEEEKRKDEEIEEEEERERRC